MNHQDATSDRLTLTAPVVESSGGRDVFQRLPRQAIPASGETHTDRAAARLAWALWALSLLLLIGYIPLRVLWHTAATAPGPNIPPHFAESLRANVVNVIADIFYL